MFYRFGVLGPQSSSAIISFECQNKAPVGVRDALHQRYSSQMLP